MHKLPRIASVIGGAKPGELKIRWKDKSYSTVDLSGWIASGGQVLAPLKDGNLFQSPHVADYGAAVAWGDDEDLAIDADHLRMIAEEQRLFDREEIVRWQTQMNLSNNEAADFLHIGLSTFNAYKAGASPVPIRIAMICRASVRDPILMHAHYRPRRAGRPRKLAG